MIEILESRDHQLIAQLNEEVQNLHARIHPEMFKPYDRVEMEKAMANFFTDPDCRCYVAKQNGKAIGYAVFLIKEVKENAFHHALKTLYIDQISVLTEYQNTGTGNLLMEQAEKLAKELSIPKIELDHWSSNTEAAAYFRKKGYRLYRERLFKMIAGN